MSRSPFVSLSSCALLALLLLPGDALAQGFTEADLAGDYAFELTSSADNNNSATRLGSMRIIGRFSADGSGNVAGSRWFLRDELAAGGTGGTGVTEALEQEFTGTYSIEADGTGFMTISPTPNPPWTSTGASSLILEDSETLHLVLADGGREVGLMFDVPAAEVFDADGSVRWLRAIKLAGHAASQTPNETLADDLADLSDRVDVLTDLIARQSAQLCELLRLVNTPQGQRATGSPEVLDACGTGYEWNGEGTGGPPRGR